MPYVALKGREQAIDNAEALIKTKRRDDQIEPELSLLPVCFLWTVRFRGLSDSVVEGAKVLTLDGWLEDSPVLISAPNLVRGGFHVAHCQSVLAAVCQVTAA